MDIKLLKANSMFRQKIEEITHFFPYFFIIFHYIALDHHISASTGTKALNFLKNINLSCIYAGCRKEGENSWGL